MDQGDELRAHFLSHGLLFGEQIVNFARILRQIVELGPRRVDEMIFGVLRASQFTPVEVNSRQEGLSIEDAVAVGLVSSKLGKQAAPLNLWRDLHPDSA